MGLTIEISFDIRKNADVTQFKQLLSNLAERYNSNSNYFIHEIEGHNTIIDRNDCIHIVEFPLCHKDIINYIKNIMRVKNIKIDSIYLDRGQINLIYASKKYLSTMSINKYSAPYKPITQSKLIELVSNTIA